MPFLPPAPRVGIPPGPATSTSPSSSPSSSPYRSGQGNGASRTAIMRNGRVRPRPTSSPAAATPSTAVTGGGESYETSSPSHHRPTSSRGSRNGTTNTVGGNPIWVQTTVLEHYLGGGGDSSAGEPSVVGTAARRRLGLGGSSISSRQPPSSSSGRGGDWGWVRGWAVPCSSPTAAAVALPLPSNDQSIPASSKPTSDAPTSPFGHVKLRRVGSSAASPRFADEQQQPQQSSPTSRFGPGHRSNSSPIPTSSGTRKWKNNAAKQQVQQSGQEMDDRPIQALTVTIRDGDYPHYNGQTLIIAPEHVKEGTAPANPWWSSVTSTSTNMPPDDLIELTHLHEPAVVHCLRTRYERAIVYTHTGPILLACNPFRTYDHLYSEDTMRRYWASEAGDPLPPHVYGTADGAFRAMMRAFEDGNAVGDQSILVSGESGAGKTVTTKIVMRYLATLSQQCSTSAMAASPQDAAIGHSREGGIEQQVLQSNPILESFGNARTVRNDNSSRFGKFIEMQFHRSGSLSGASIETYLLEKVRLISQSRGERNFHIFYELLAPNDSAAQADRAALGLDRCTPEDFAMTAASGTFDRRDGVQDADTYRELKVAMDTVGFSPEEQMEILSIPAALLFCSNLTFLEGSSHDGSSEIDIDNPSLSNALHLLGVTGDALNNAICTSTIEVAGETLRKVLSRDQAAKALEAFMMATYGALFRYIVDQVNDSITIDKTTRASSSERSALIGVLDIFGFESFEQNSFEQLCINYCNEALQQQFNRFVFKLEQEEYEREGIEWSFIEFPDNQDVLDLIEKKHTGIISILDEQCRLSKCTDQSFVSKTYETCADHPRFLGSDRAKALGCFSVYHYAGPVEYTAESFLSKNKDELPKETTDLLNSSSSPILRELGEMLSAQSSVSPSPSSADGRFRRSSSSLSRTSVGSQFSSQLKQLRERIEQTAPHYVRCLKPNDELVPDNFVPAIIADQLRCAGVLEAVRVSRVGFPQRYAHSVFEHRYGLLGGRAFHKAQSRQRRDVICILVDELVPLIWSYQHGHAPLTDNKHEEQFSHDHLSVGLQIGKTKVFLRQRAFEALEQLRSERLGRAATKIQSVVRMFFCRDSYFFILESAVMVQTIFRGYRARRFVDDIRYYYLATIIQTTWRRFLAFDDYQNTLYLAFWCQRMYRGVVTRRRFVHVRQEANAIILQSFFRMYHPYRRFRTIVRLVTNLQQLFRAFKARQVLRQLKREAKNLDHVAKERDLLRKEAARAKEELEELKRKQELESLRLRPTYGTDDQRLNVQACDSNSLDHGGLSSVASSQVSLVYRDFPKTPTAQEEEIRALADACAAKDLEMERLRRELQSIQEEKDAGDDGPPIKTIFADHSKHSALEENSSPDTPAATEAESSATTPSLFSGLAALSPSKSSKRGLMMGRLETLMGRAGPDISVEAASTASGLSRHSASLVDGDEGGRIVVQSKSSLSDSPRKFSIKQCESREMRAYAPAALDSAVGRSASNSGDETPLHHAVRSSNIDHLSEFIGSCEDIYAFINEGGNKNRTPLHLAVLCSSLEMVSILLEHFAVPNLQDDMGNTPLHYAIDDTMAHLLLAKGGANPNIPNNDGLCPLHLAVRRKDVEAVRHLLAYKADVTVADDIRWFTPLHLVAQFREMSREILQEDPISMMSKCGEIAQMLCQATDPYEADMNYQDRDGNTPLHHAAVLEKVEGAEELISILLGHGCDPNIKNERGQSAMHLICHNSGQRKLRSYQGLIDSFLQFGADPNLPSSSGCTPLHLCLYNRDIDSAAQLVRSGGLLHLPWRKPSSWRTFWAETGLPEICCTDMITNQGDLRQILSSISTKQITPPARSTCMRCLSSFGTFGKRYHCSHCSSLVCRNCSSASIDTSELPAFCQDTDSLMVCGMCEDIILSRLGHEY